MACVRTLIVAGLVLLAVLFVDVQFALAHGSANCDCEPGLFSHPHNWSELLRAWEFEPWVVLPLLISGIICARGQLRVWNDAGVGHGIRRWEAACLWGGWFALVVALVSP